MDHGRLLHEEDFESAYMGEVSDRLNFIWILAASYRVPELLEFLNLLTCELVDRRELIRSWLRSRSATGAKRRVV